MIDLKQLFSQLMQHAPSVAKQFLNNPTSDISILAGRGYDPVLLNDQISINTDAEGNFPDDGINGDFLHDLGHKTKPFPSEIWGDDFNTNDFAHASKNDLDDLYDAASELFLPSNYPAAMLSSASMLNNDPSIGLPKSRKEFWKPYRDGWLDK